MSFVDGRVIRQRMDAKDRRIHRAYQRQLAKAKVLYDAIGEGDTVGGTANGDQTAMLPLTATVRRSRKERIA